MELDRPYARAYRKENFSISKIREYGTVITLEDGTRIYQSKEGHVVQLSTNSTLS